VVVSTVFAFQGIALIRRVSKLHPDGGSDTETFCRLTERDPIEKLIHRITEQVEGSNSGPGKDDETDAAHEGDSRDGREKSGGLHFRAYLR
jgi:hypothetical protein